MAIRSIFEGLEEFSTAVKWAETFFDHPPTQSRYYTYLKVLRELAENAKNGPETGAKIPVSLVLESSLQATILIRLYRSFSRATPPVCFGAVFRKAYFGPILATDENPENNSNSARNFEFELFMASLVADPTKIDFSNNDFQIGLSKYKLGIECKRIHSLERVLRLFKNACKQIEDTASIEHGLVALRIDKFFYPMTTPIESSKIEPLADHFLSPVSENQASNAVVFQTEAFRAQYGEAFEKVVTGRFPKVCGICIVSILPGFIPQTNTPFTPIQFNFSWFSKGRPHAEAVVKEFMSCLTPAAEL
jgi:hypothetical protein